MIFPGQWEALTVALLVDAAIGDPVWLWRRVPHPVAGIGRLIGWLDRRWNRTDDSPARRRSAGVAAAVLLVASATGAGLLLDLIFRQLHFGWLATGLAAAILLAGRSLIDHVRAVAVALERAGLVAGRRMVAKIVGRDTGGLDTDGVSRAAIESAAENLSDGLVAPVLWFALCGLPGLLVYKAINTADSMIGHIDARYRDFGWAAARFDDVLNWPAARLSALLVAAAAPVAGGSAIATLSAAWADADHHRSPNAGWPEAAMAGALDLRLGGARTYRDQLIEESPFNETGRADASPDDIRRAVGILIAAAATLTGISAVLATAMEWPS